MIVIDASLLLGRLLGEPAALTAVANATAAAPGRPLQAPELIELELLQALRRLVRIGAVSEERAVDVLTDLRRRGSSGTATAICEPGSGSFATASPPTTPRTSCSPSASGRTRC